MAREDEGKNLEPGFVARVAEGLKYMVTGKPPSDGGRGKMEGTTFFGPQKPLTPVAPDAESRQFDYPTSYNLTTTPRAYENISFAQLRSLADSYDLLRLVIETRKDQVEAYDWTIQAKEGKTVSDEQLQQAKDFFLSPDKEHPWSTWLRMMLEDLFVMDVITIYPRGTAGGGMYAFELMDGATIKRVIDATGRTPLPPEPAYQQVLKGLPAVNYTREELIYMMRNPRTNRIYGYSPVEQIIMTVNIALRRQVFQLNYYTEGNIPEAIAGLPESWNTEQIKAFQIYWDDLMEGNLAKRRHMRFVPFDPSKIAFTKNPELKDMFDEWLARVVCFAFSISPTMLVKETNRATADSVQEAAKTEGLVPLLNWLKRMLDFLLADKLKMPDLEFVWNMQRDLDPLVQAQVDEIYLSSKVILPEEVRERLGLPELTPEQEEKLNPPPPPGLLPGAEGGAPLPGQPPFGGGSEDPTKKKPPFGAKPKPGERSDDKAAAGRKPPFGKQKEK